MSKFVQLSDGNIINTDFISHICPVHASEIDMSDEWALTQAGAVKTPRLTWHECKDFAEVRRQVAEDPIHRGWSPDFTNPGFYEATDELAYTTKRLDGKGGYRSGVKLLTAEQLESIAYYQVNLVTPCGGINYSHVTMSVTKDDFMKIKDVIGLNE